MNNTNLLKIIKANKSIALLAPSFPIDFEYPSIIGMLRELGFDRVSELTFGARMVNWRYKEYILSNPDQKYFIASPCPTIVALIKNSYPDLKKYLIPIASPMLATAAIYKKHHPDYKIFFISPCLAKKTLEAPEHTDFIDGVITFKELNEFFEYQKIKKAAFNRHYYFDSLIREYTKIFPISGGLAETAHIQNIFKQKEIFIADGVANLTPVFDQMTKDKCQYRFLDILNCNGGCIGGPAIVNQCLSVKEKKEKIKKYFNLSSRHNLGEHEGTVDYADDIPISVSIT